MKGKGNKCSTYDHFSMFAVLFVPVDSRTLSCNIYLVSHQKAPPYFNLLLIKSEILNKIMPGSSL